MIAIEVKLLPEMSSHFFVYGIANITYKYIIIKLLTLILTFHTTINSGVLVDVKDLMKKRSFHVLLKIFVKCFEPQII